VAIRFADTTALLELHAGTSASRSAARQALQPKDEVATSEHVQREWKRILVSAVGSLVEAVDNEPDLSAAFARLGNGYGRTSSQRWRAAAMVTGSAGSFNAVETKIRGRQLLRGLDSRLRRGVGDVRSSSSCGLAREQPHEGGDGRWRIKDTCKRGEGICAHESRLGRDVARWRSGADALARNEDPALRKMGKTGQEMAARPQVRTGVNCYGRTGDLAIALDCRANELLVTTDASFEVIAQGMGFTIHRISIRT
jgi:hypothetical protein